MNILKSAWEHLHDHVVPNQRNNFKPHLVAHRSLHLYAALLVAVKVLMLFSLALLPENQANSSAVSVRNILELTNYSRESYNLVQLQENTMLDRAAQAKASDMFQKQYFAHVSPTGVEPWDFIKGAGYNYIIAGENLAIDFYSSEGVSQAWMNSPEHKANILNPDFRDIGIGVAQGRYQGANAVLVVQMFGTGSEQIFTPKNAFTTPTPLADKTQTVPMPAIQRIALAKPVLNNPGYILTNKKELLLSGQAVGADSVYVLVNHLPKDELFASNGIFYGKVSLDEGQNSIAVVGFDDKAQASPISDPLSIKVDTAAPSIVNASVTPQELNGQLYYKIVVQSQGSPVKITASLGTETVLLQPTSSPNTWQGTLKSNELSAGQLQNPLTISAYDLAGNVSQSRVANVTDSAQASFGFAANKQPVLKIFGRTISGNAVNLFYAYFIAGLLLAIGITIAIRKKIQHTGLIAHASAVVVLAVILWVV